MPETGIGFFPDVGGTWLLSRGPGETGTYLGLTGEQIGGANAIQAGLADFCMPISVLADLVAALSSLPTSADGDDVTDIIRSFAKPASLAKLQEHRDEIDDIFAADDVEAIIAALARSTTDFASETRATLLTKSPTSLKVTLRLLRLARASASLEECLEREYATARHIFRGHDFREGVRAAVIDKDRNPRWSPASLAEISDRTIDTYFMAAPELVFTK
jgi:enoyl-CoA hydratase